jgi:hypothetical protein
VLLRSKKVKNKGDNDSIYLSAARTIAHCHDLWCEPDKVFKIARLLHEEEASKYGDLDEDELGREAREDYLNSMCVRCPLMDTTFLILLSISQSRGITRVCC